MSQLSTQREIDAEITAQRAAWTAGGLEHPPSGADPGTDYPPYRSTALRSPARALVAVDPEGVELWAPCFGERDVTAADADLTLGCDVEPIGERMVITGRVLDGAGRPVRRQLVEVWQANAAGRYAHERDDHRAPLDPGFLGAGRCLTDDDGTYRFTTIKPGPYPWRNHRNAWRPAHIHFSVFGTDVAQRLVTQAYFPGDPLLGLDPIIQAVREPAARERLVASYDHDVTVAGTSTGYRWDIVLDGARRTAREDDVEATRGDRR